MTITIKNNKTLVEIKDHIYSSITDLNTENYDDIIQEENITKLRHLFNNTTLTKKVNYAKGVRDLKYEDLLEISLELNDFKSGFDDIKKDVDTNIFFNDGNLINIKKLKKKFYERKKHNIPYYKDFNFDRLEELFYDEKISILSPDDNQYIKYDLFVVRKYLYGIIQMVLDEMDLLIIYTGKEGSGKSKACSQDILLVHWLLSELKLIKYDYYIKDMFFNNLTECLACEDKYFDERFRIVGMDEGNELNRKNWQDEKVQTYFGRLRRERFNQRIRFICIPQLGELMTDITQDRANFIFYMNTKGDFETGTLDKGICDFYIVPRGDFIYSNYSKKNLSQEDVKEELGKYLENKKSYLKGIPKNILIHRFNKPNIWGFNHNEYVKHLKNTNSTFTAKGGVSFSDLQLYCFYKTNPGLSNFNLDLKEGDKTKDSPYYTNLKKFVGSINKRFDVETDSGYKLVMKYDEWLRRKQSEQK